MIRYVRIKKKDCCAQALALNYRGVVYYPCVYHTAIGQDRAVGQAEMLRAHRHDLYQVVVYTQGNGACVVNKEKVKAVPGRVVLISPGQWHDVVTHQNSTVYSEVTFSFESTTEQVLTVSFKRLLQLYTGVPMELSPYHLGTNEVSHRLNAMVLQLTDQANSDDRITNYCIQQGLARILDWIVWSCTSFHESTQKLETRLAKVKRFLESNYAQSLTVEQIADIAGLSKGYLFRAFREAYGLPPMAYHKQLRIEAAKTLLRSTALRCYEVGLRCGYKNIPLFHRMFKAATGVTTSQFRKQSQGDPPKGMAKKRSRMKTP